jgi:hypothetical protein
MPNLSYDSARDDGDQTLRLRNRRDVGWVVSVLLAGRKVLKCGEKSPFVLPASCSVSRKSRPDDHEYLERSLLLFVQLCTQLMVLFCEWSVPVVGLRRKGAGKDMLQVVWAARIYTVMSNLAHMLSQQLKHLDDVNRTQSIVWFQWCVGRDIGIEHLYMCQDLWKLIRAVRPGRANRSHIPGFYSKRSKPKSTTRFYVDGPQVSEKISMTHVNIEENVSVAELEQSDSRSAQSLR